MKLVDILYLLLCSTVVLNYISNTLLLDEYTVGWFQCCREPPRAVPAAPTVLAAANGRARAARHNQEATEVSHTETN